MTYHGKYKGYGILFILTGVSIFAFFIFASVNHNELVVPGSTFFLIKYFPHIFLVNVALLCLVIGYLFLNGKAVPYYYADEYEKAKNYIVSFGFLCPSMVASVCVMITSSSNNFAKISWVLLCCFGVFEFFSSLKIYKKHKEEGTDNIIK